MIDDALIREAMQAIGARGISFEGFCGYLGLTDDQARRLLHELSHRNLAGFAGGWVSPAFQPPGDARTMQYLANGLPPVITRVWRCREDRVEIVLERDARELARRGYDRKRHEYADGRLAITYELHHPTNE